MKAGVFPLIVFDLDGDLRLGLALGSFDVGVDDVVLSARRNSLRKLPALIGNQFPLGFLAGGTVDRDGNASQRTVVGGPDGADDQGIIFGRRALLGHRIGRRMRCCNQRTCGGKQQQNHCAASERGAAATMRRTNAHATPLPLRPRLPLRRRSRPGQRGSTAAARSPPLRNPCRTPGRSRLHPRPPHLLRSPDRSRTQDKSPWPTSSTLRSADAPTRITAPSTLLYLESLATSVK